jgi:hypothetical protein
MLCDALTGLTTSRAAMVQQSSGQRSDPTVPRPQFLGLEHPAPHAHGESVALGVFARPRGGSRWLDRTASGPSAVRAASR